MEIPIIILIILLCLLIIPIPIKLNVSFGNGILDIKILNKSLNLNRPKEKKTKLTKNKKGNRYKFYKNPYFYKIFFSKLKKRKLKPVIKITGFINYSLGDAALTAISYGLISTFTSFLYIILNVVFKFKTSNIKINPILQKEKNLGVNINCIFYISIAHIIHMFILFLSSIIKLKEVSLFGESYE